MGYISKRRFYIPITIFIIVLAFVFLRKEHIDFNQKINDVKIANYFLVIGAVATASSLFLLYTQLKEMEEDRKASNKPELYPETTHFELIFIQMPMAVGLTDVVAVRGTNEQTDMLNRESHINIYNIGLGAAKEITFEWQFPREEIEQIVKDVVPTNTDPLPKNQTANFLLPGKVEKIGPPRYYLKCCYKDFNDRTVPFVDQIDVSKSHKPPLLLKINYKDIYDNLITKRFNVVVHAHYNHATFYFKEQQTRPQG